MIFTDVQYVRGQSNPTEAIKFSCDGVSGMSVPNNAAGNADTMMKLCGR